MKLMEICINTSDIERTKVMFMKYFGAQAGETMRDEQFEIDTCFLSFPDGGQIQLSRRPGLTDGSAYPRHTGCAQIVLSAGSREKVREVTMQIYQDGYTVANMPRVTSYGRFESMVLDFDGNFIVITE